MIQKVFARYVALSEVNVTHVFIKSSHLDVHKVCASALNVWVLPVERWRVGVSYLTSVAYLEEPTCPACLEFTKSHGAAT